MGLLDNNRFLFAGNKQINAGTLSIATANQNILTIPAKAGYPALRIDVKMSSVGTFVSVISDTNTSKEKLLYCADGSLSYCMKYYQNIPYLQGPIEQSYFVNTNEEETITLKNREAITGGTIEVVVTYLKEFPVNILQLKPRQVLLRAEHSFSAGDTTWNSTISTYILNGAGNGLMLCPFFKYVSLQAMSYNSGGSTKAITANIKTYFSIYAPFDTHPSSSVLKLGYRDFSLAISNRFSGISDWTEMLGYLGRIETTLTNAAAEGDKLILQYIGIR